MNLLLIQAEDFDSSFDCTQSHGQCSVRITGRRAEHLIKVIKVDVGSQIKCGILNQLIGTCEVASVKKDLVILNFDAAQFTQQAKPALDIQLLLALPRPNMLRRILHHATELGVKDIHLFHSEKVEKSFWQSPVLKDENIHETLCLGLEQSMDTILPKVTFHKNPKQFIDDLPEIKQQRLALIAHPYQAQSCPTNLTQACSLLIGPEGGFSMREVEAFQALDFTSVHIGERILRVENAVTAVISRLANWA